MVIESRMICKVKHSFEVKITRGHTGFWWAKPEKNRSSEDLGVGGDNIKLILTLRLLMSYIYIYIYIYIYMEHLFLMFLDHTQRRSTVGRTPLDE